MPWELAILLGAVCSPTDAAAVFSVLRVVPLPRRLTGTLEQESGLNDAPTVVLVTLISTGAVDDHGLLAVAGIIVFELAIGVMSGIVFGFGVTYDTTPEQAQAIPDLVKRIVATTGGRCWR